MGLETRVEWVPHQYDNRISTLLAEGSSVQPQELDVQKAEVLCMPVNGSAPFKLKLDTFEVDEKCTYDEETAGSEASARHVPNIPSYTRANFVWQARYLVEANLGGDAVPNKLKGRWYMYKCKKAIPGLDSNENPLFKDEEGKPLAFGDVFVFKQGGAGFDRFGRVRYAKEWSFPEGKVGDTMLKEMAKQ